MGKADRAGNLMKYDGDGRVEKGKSGGTKNTTRENKGEERGSLERFIIQKRTVGEREEG